MIRPLYAALIKLHPAGFRHRFGDEMLSIFDQTAGGERRTLVGDAIVSLLRQWLLRSDSAETESARRVYIAGAPAFAVLDDEPRLTREEWMWGVLLSVFGFTIALFSIAYGGNHAVAVVGTPLRSNSSGVRIEAAPAEKLGTTVVIPQDPILSGSARRLVEWHFGRNHVLNALDRNRDLVLSAYEIATAPAALRSLDANGDGVLDENEYGAKERVIYTFAGLPYVDPVIQALDANHDGVISADEIAKAPASLRGIDTDGDGRLTPAEFLPPNLLEAFTWGPFKGMNQP